ncbi:MFS transporter [Micromonospora zhanjiangensis]
MTEVGLGLTATALVNLVASAPMGYLADRYGPRGVQLVGLVASGFCSAALLTVRSLPAFLIVGAATALADAAAKGARGAIIAGAVPPGERVRTRAYLRAVTNVGISFGAVAAGFGIAVDTRPAYVSLVLVDAATFLLAAAILVRLAPIPPVPAPTHGPRLVALRDRPFLAFTVLDGLMSMHFGLLNIALPLWISGHTHAPRWLISALMLGNTVVVVLFQVRAARGTEELSGAARASRRAGVAVALACVLFAAGGLVSTGFAVVLLVAGSLAHVTGELWQSAAGWGSPSGWPRPTRTVSTRARTGWACSSAACWRRSWSPPWPSGGEYPAGCCSARSSRWWACCCRRWSGGRPGPDRWRPESRSPSAERSVAGTGTGSGNDHSTRRGRSPVPGLAGCRRVGGAGTTAG